MGDHGATESIRRIAMLGNHLPRQCGIATFTTDLARSARSGAPEDRLLRARGERCGTASRVSPARPVRDHRAGPDLLPPRRRLLERERSRRPVAPARVRDLRRQGRQPCPDAAPRAADADRHHAPHDPRSAERSPAPSDGRARRPVVATRRDDGGRCGAPPRGSSGTAIEDRSDPARNPEPARRRSKASARRRRQVRAPDVWPAVARQGHRARDRRAAGDSRAPSGDRLHRARRDPPAREGESRGDLPARARGARCPARRRSQRDLPRPLRQQRRAHRVPRGGRHLRDAVPQHGAEHLRDARVRGGIRPRGDLDAVSPCQGAARRRPRDPRPARGCCGDRTRGERPARRRREAPEPRRTRGGVRCRPAVAVGRARVPRELRTRVRRTQAAGPRETPGADTRRARGGATRRQLRAPAAC